jgi:hypothetical protein
MPASASTFVTDSRSLRTSTSRPQAAGKRQRRGGRGDGSLYDLVIERKEGLWVGSLTLLPPCAKSQPRRVTRFPFAAFPSIGEYVVPSPKEASEECDLGHLRRMRVNSADGRWATCPTFLWWRR